jgi:RecA-family ATPase
VASEAMRALGSLIDGSVNGRMMPKSLGEVLDVEDEYDWIIDGLLERHDRLVITGPEGGGKSTLVRQLVILPAAGLHPLYFTPMEPISALIVDAENTERQWRRAATWMANRAREAGARDPREFVHIVAGRRIDITSGTDLGQIHRMIDRYEPDLVYIGPLYKLVPNAITNDDDAAPLITALDSLRERGVALVMEAHAGHAKSLGGERDLRPRGSSALLGWPEFGMGIQPIEGEQGFASLVRWRGDRESRSWPTTIKRGLSWPWEPCD